MNEVAESARFPKNLFHIWITERPNQLAAALAYFGMFSLAPIIYVAFSVAGLFIDAASMLDRILDRLETTVGTEVAALIRNLVEVLDQPSDAGSAMLSVVSFFVLLFAASNFFFQLQFALNKIWRVTPPERGQTRAFITQRLFSFVMVFVVSLVLVALAFVNLIGVWLGSMLGVGLFDSHLAIPAIVLVTTLAFALLYKTLPDVDITWRSVWLGAGVASLLITLGSGLVAWLLTSGRIDSGLAAAGAFVVVLLLFYFIAQIFLFGAVVSREFSNWDELRSQSR